MSPRAAWQLEALGFKHVYDFVPGKVAWIISHLPLEGTGPHYPVVGEVAQRDRVHECRIGDVITPAVEGFASGELDYCVVLNQENILMGRLRKKAAVAAPPGAIVDEVMQVGPTTTRPGTSAEDLVKRMQERKVPAVLVTTSKGRFLGVARRRDLEELVEASKSEHPVSGLHRRR